MDASQTTARAIAIAREDTGKTAAEFDYTIAVEGVLNGYTALFNAVYAIANEGRRADPADEQETRARQLFEQLRPELQAYAARCRARKYTGWSRYSSGPIRYAR